MTRRPLKQAVLLLALPLAACGGSSHSSSPPPTTTSAATPRVTVTAESSSSAQPPPKPRHKHHTSTKDTNVRVPALFTIHAGGALTPPSVAAPKKTDIQLTIRSGDGKRHSFAIDLPHRYATVVRPGHPVRKLLADLHNGHYAIVVDGAARGTLIVGAVPGP